jgi:hypothetical protein
MNAKRFNRFVSRVLPVVRAYAYQAFAAFDPDRRAECVAEAVSAAFVSFVSLLKRRRASKVTPGRLAYFAVKHVRSGRHVGGSQNGAQDGMTPRNGRSPVRFGTIEDLPYVLQDALVDNTQPPVPEQAAFRIDFSAFLAGQPEKKQEVAMLLAQGHRAKDVASAVGVSPGRVTQIRQELHEEWSATASA